MIMIFCGVDGEKAPLPEVCTCLHPDLLYAYNILEVHLKHSIKWMHLEKS